MIRAIQTPLSSVRAFLVLALMAMTMWAGVSSAEAQILNSAHIARGDAALADGGWPSACERNDQACAAFPESEQELGLLGLHHHHHADCQFNALPAHIDEGSLVLTSVRRLNVAYQSILKPASLGEVDQPPKI
ncbi:hypothetical protein [Asticcacaulis taihuensis]|jgi:hypothetical protein|uniref:hypothetical protein n=1 Tax=Asticcacaulis taihuensis TaxID=260084 RepID=UPI0026F21078|nr:hypothetical protein [Asticcacaulis taihuensis]